MSVFGLLLYIAIAPVCVMVCILDAEPVAACAQAVLLVLCLIELPGACEEENAWLAECAERDRYWEQLRRGDS